ncbi:MAG: hypothetical protein ABIT36_09575 [Steroidobacteraceae bacterium]
MSVEAGQALWVPSHARVAGSQIHLFMKQLNAARQQRSVRAGHGGLVTTGRSDAVLNPGDVRNVIHGKPVANSDALGNPQVPQPFRDLPDLAT